VSSDSAPVRVPWTIEQQRSAILDFFATVEARSWCSRCCRKFGLPEDMVGDVLSSAYIRVASALDRRTVPFDDMSTIDSASRYAARACENASIDFARAARRRREVPTVNDEMSDIGSDDANLAMHAGRWALEEMRRVVVTLSREGHPCSGCPPEVVLAAALQIINSQLMGDSASISDLMYEALEAVDTGFPGGKSDAARQRKMRCGRCVVGLLRRAVEVIEERS